MDLSSYKQLTQQVFDLTEEALKKSYLKNRNVIEFKELFQFEKEKDTPVIETHYPKFCDALEEHLDNKGFSRKHIYFNLYNYHGSEPYMIISVSFNYSTVYTWAVNENQDKNKFTSKKKIFKREIYDFIKKYHEQYQLRMMSAFDFQEEDRNPIHPNTLIDTYSVDNLQNNDVYEPLTKICPGFALKHVLGMDGEPFNDNPDLSIKLSWVGKETMKMLARSHKTEHDQGADKAKMTITQDFDVLGVGENGDICYIKNANVIVGINADGSIDHFQGLVSKTEKKIRQSYLLPPQNLKGNPFEESSSENMEIGVTPSVFPTVAEPGKAKELFVKNLSNDNTTDSLMETLEGASSARIATCPDSGKSKGFGFEKFDSPDDYKADYKAMQGQSVDGREVTIDYTVERDKGGVQGGGRGGFGGGRDGGQGGGFGGRGSEFRGRETCGDSGEEVTTTATQKAMQGQSVDGREVTINYAVERDKGDVQGGGRGGFGGGRGTRGGFRGGGTVRDRGGGGERGGRSGWNGRQEYEKKRETRDEGQNGHLYVVDNPGGMYQHSDKQFDYRVQGRNHYERGGDQRGSDDQQDWFYRRMSIWGRGSGRHN